MFILPRTGRRSLAEGAIEGTGKVLDALNDIKAMRSEQRNREALLENPSLRTLLGANVSPQQFKALYEDLPQEPLPLRRKDREALTALDLRENKALEKQIFQSASAGRNLIESAHRLRKLATDGKMSGAFTHYLSQKTGIPLSILGGADDELFQKETEALLPIYLRKNYQGRILLAEVQSQARAIVKGDNSPEAKLKLIDAIEDLGRVSQEAADDYKQVIKKYGKQDPYLQQHLEELARERLDSKLNIRPDIRAQLEAILDE